MLVYLWNNDRKMITFSENHDFWVMSPAVGIVTKSVATTSILCVLRPNSAIIIKQCHILIIVMVRHKISMNIWMKPYVIKNYHHDTISTFQNYDAGASNYDFTSTYVSITTPY